MSKNTKNYQLYTFTSDNDVADLKLLEHSFDTIDKGLVLDVGESTGSGNNYILNLGSITLTSTNKGISFKFWADKNASGVVKINGTYNLVKPNGSSVTNLKKGAPYTITYDGGTNFFLASGGGTDDVNFSASDLLTGKSANDSNGEKVNGTMPNKGAVTASLNCGGSYTIPKGYHNGSGKVTANSLASQTGANATAGDILVDKTAYVNGAKITGTMPNNGAITTSLNCGGSYTIPAGYHNGSGKVTANSLASQTSANATTGDILVDKTAWVNGSKITGTIPNRGEYQMAGGIGSGDDYIALNKIPYGYYPQSSNGWSPEIRAKKTDVAKTFGITADKIVEGNNILGVTGTYKSINDIWAYTPGTIVLPETRENTTIVSIPFEPSIIMGFCMTETGKHYSATNPTGGDIRWGVGNGRFFKIMSGSYAFKHVDITQNRTCIQDVTYSDGKLTIYSKGSYGGSDYRYTFMIIAIK